MKESVAIAKDAAAKKESSPTRSDKSIQRLRNEPERQLGSLRAVIGNIRRDGGTPSVESISTELSVMHTAQRASVLLALQQTHGNQYVQRVVTGIQAKLKVGQPGDKYEQEADRVAEQVMHMPEPRVRQPEEEEEKEGLMQTPLAEQISPLVQRQVEPEKEENEEEEIIQTKENPGQTPEVTPDFESRIQSLKSSGQSLPEADRGFMERRFGIDFSGVRLHTDSDAAQMSRELNAEAFTHGRDIYFGAGRYNSPGTLSGRRLLAHELTHMVQQQGMEGTIRCFPADEDECPGYQPGEISTSRTASGHLDPDVTLHAPGRLLIADFGVGRQSVKPSTQTEPLLRSWLSTYESDNSYRLRIAGYSDCVGSDSDNTRIRHGRAEQVERLLGSGARSRVTFRGMAGLGDYVTNNSTIENRARNRGVIIEFRQEITLPPVIISVPPISKGIYRINEPTTGWAPVSPIYFIIRKGEPSELPHFCQVSVTTPRSSRSRIEIMEGRYRGKDADIENRYLTSDPGAGPAATVIFDISSGNLRYGNSSPVSAITDPNNPTPTGIHYLEIPDFSHSSGSAYGPYGTTWFRVGHSGDRYLHPGRRSAGCVTVTEISKWASIYRYLISARISKRSVGGIIVK